MSQTDLIPIEDEDLGEQVLRYRLQGQTARQISRKMMISVPQVHRALDAILPTIDGNYRRRAIAESLVQIDTAISTHMASTADPESCNLVIRGVAERRALLGLTGSGYDPTQLVAVGRDREKSTAAFQRAFRHVLGQRGALSGQKIDKPSD
jgi:hypothetical protein